MRHLKSHKAFFLSTALLLALLLLSNGRRPADHAFAQQSAAAQQGTSVPPRQGASRAEMPTDQIIVRFAGDARPQADQAGELDRLSRAAGVALETVRPMAGGGAVLRLPHALPPGQAEAISAALEAAPGVLYAEPDRIMQAVGRTAVARPLLEQDGGALFAPDAAAIQPDDTRFGEQWHFRYQAGSDEGVNLPPAWNKTTGSNDVVVAVVDTGILDHEDLIGRTVGGYDFISDVNIANDGNGRDPDPSDPGDWEPADVCYSGSPAYDSSWHGSHVAGTIGAASNNGMGVAGINWQAKILPIRVLGRCGGYTSDVLDGAMWAAGLSVTGLPKNDHPADVINLSLGAVGECSQVEQTVFNQIASTGALVVVAAGNQNMNVENFSPANCQNVVAVAATGRSGDRASYSNYGSLIEISAPGGSGVDGVLSTSNDGDTDPQKDIYAYFRGTSMAAPHVAGVASLLIGLNPGLSPDQIVDRLQNSARAFPAGSDCNPSICGAGIVDAAGALNAGQPPTPTSTPTPTPTPTATLTPTPEGLPAPAIETIANKDGNGNFTVVWSSVPDADRYVVHQKRDDRNWRHIYEGIDTRVGRSSLPDGSYCYRVRAFDAETSSKWSAVECTAVGATPTPRPKTTYSQFLPLLTK